MAGNYVELIGNLTRDPELRFIPSGAAVANFGLAVNRRWRNQQSNEWEEEVAFFDIVCWRDLAENVSESLTKGTRVIVQGKLKQRSYETREGERRTVVELEVDEIGPSLRYATAKVTRTPRGGSSGGNFGGGGGGYGGGNQGGGYGAPAGGSRPVWRAAPSARATSPRLPPSSRPIGLAAVKRTVPAG